MVTLAAVGLLFMGLVGGFCIEKAEAQEFQNTGSAMVEQWDDVQGELGAADVPLTQQQWLEILRQEKLPLGGKTDINDPLFSGRFSWRVQNSGGTGHSMTRRLGFQGMGSRGRIRQVAGDQRESELGGFLLFEKSDLSVGMGDFGINHGFGLLKAGPGRGAYLAADSKLGMKRQGLRSWAGGSEAGSIRGASIQWNNGSQWDALILLGSLPVTGNKKDPQPSLEKMVRIGGAFHAGQWGLLVVGTGNDKGFSLTGSGEGKSIHGSFELAGWQTGVNESLPVFAWAMEIGLHPRGAWVLEGIAVATDGTGFFTGGKLPFIPAGEGGQGWFLRGGKRMPGVGHLLVMTGRMKHRTLTGTGQRHNTTLLDLQGRWLPKSGIEVTARWRRRQRQSETWSAIYPWQAPHVVGQEFRSVLTGGVKFKSKFQTGKIMVRSYQQGKNESWGTRSLVTVSMVYRLGAGASLQGSNTTAWGDPIDLVSAISPMAGLVLPRHWGSWREETTFGLKVLWRTLQGRIGLSRRIPEKWNTGPVLTSLWAEGRFHW